ncbi:hypothetical protein EC07798_2655, partial [Escherichia coli 07798]
SP